MTVPFLGFLGAALTWHQDFLGDPSSYAVQVLRIVGIDIVLAGDNAVVIALACRTLPPRQRMKGIVLGAAVAIVLRVVFTLLVQQLLDVALLRLFGGLLLFWIAVKLVIAEENEAGVKSGTSLWEAVRIIALADIIMSLDNVLAVAAAAHGDPALIVFGLLVSIPLVVGGATLITELLTRYPLLIWAGAALLGWIAGELIATEPFLSQTLQKLAEATGVSLKAVTRTLEVAGAALVCGVGYLIKQNGTARGEA